MKELEKAYDPQKYEAKIYQQWEENGFFKPNLDSKEKPFTIIMPPPNANDNLHIGHARFVYIEDIMARYWRMKGRPTLWAPGADHAGIETQFVFEKRLAKEGKSRFDFDQETLYKMIWDYVAENRVNMETQLRALGASCDWSRMKFTLDPDIKDIVYKTFKKLSDDELLYRGERVVNYCVRCGTAFSQLEVNYDEREDKLYYLNYGTIEIATTRPETIFADVAVAVNPKDKRFKKLVGQIATVPLIGREVPIIADEAVELEFGTGALKITPAHDATDFEIGQRHNLPLITIINKQGKMVEVPADFAGLRPKVARELTVQKLEEAGLLVKVEPINHSVGVCYRCNAVIEPMLEDQWFIKVAPLAEGALKAIEDRKTVFAAKKFEKVAMHWLTDLKDWNISRQIAWGMRIPAWHCEVCNEWIITDGEEPQKCKCGSANLKQDRDTFDTWFSSGQWPFAILKANSEEDFKQFYPTSMMETSYDILFFWVIRMMMLGIYVTGETPFEDVVLHGLVRDKHGVKISKSKGNVINPLEMIEKYGSDALRMSLVWGTLVENDMSLSEDNIKGQKYFANKVWNASRFVMMNLEDYKIVPRGTIEKELTTEDKNILSKLDNAINEVSKNIETYRLNIASEAVYTFFWKEFCDVYIEDAKKRINDNDRSKLAAQYTLDYVLEESLKLIHPFMPFVTEAIWANLGQRECLIITDWPKISIVPRGTIDGVAFTALVPQNIFMYKKVLFSGFTLIIFVLFATGLYIGLEIVNKKRLSLANYYSEKATSVNGSDEKLIYLLKSDALAPGSNKKIDIATAFLNKGEAEKAEIYLILTPNQPGNTLLAEYYLLNKPDIASKYISRIQDSTIREDLSSYFELARGEKEEYIPNTASQTNTGTLIRAINTLDYEPLKDTPLLKNIYSTISSSNNDYGQTIALAEYFTNVDQPHMALFTLKSLTSRTGNLPQISARMAEAYLQLKDKAAIDMISRAIEQEPENQSHYIAGIAYAEYFKDTPRKDFWTDRLSDLQFIQR